MTPPTEVKITQMEDSVAEAIAKGVAGDQVYNQVRAGSTQSLESPNVQSLFTQTDQGRQYSEQFQKVVRNLVKQGDNLKGGFENFNKGIIDLYRDNAENYDLINRAFGGYIDHASLAESSQTTVKMAVDRYDSMVDAYGNTTDKFIELQRKAGKTITKENEERLQEVGVDFITRYFKSGQEAASVQAEVVNLLVTQNAEAINNMDDLTGKELALIRRNTEFSAETIATIMESTIVRTGEATNDAFFKIAGFSKQMADDTGLSQDLIQNGIAKTVANIEQFGFVTEREAARISTQLLQLGMKFETFTGLTQKFQDFSSSATMTGDISQLTGGAVQLDAQELSYLASEDQDEFIRELRRSFLDQGFDKEQFMAMTNAEQRAIAQSMGMERKEFAMLIDRERKVSSREQLDRMLKEAEDSKKTSEKGAMEIIKGQREAYDKTDEDITAEMRRKAMDRNRKEATAQIKQLVELRKEMMQAVNPPDVMAEFGGATALKAIGSGLTEMFSQFNKDGKYLNSVGEGMETFRNIIAGGFDEAFKAANEKTAEHKQLPQSLPPIWVEYLKALETDFVPGIKKNFMEAGIAAGTGFEAGFATMGMDPDSLIAKFEAVTKVKTEPIMIQKNIEQLTRLLKEIQDVDSKKYVETVEKLASTVDAMNKYLEKIDSSNTLIKSVLEKERNVTINMDAIKVGKAILNKSGQIETDAGAKFGVEV